MHPIGSPVISGYRYSNPANLTLVGAGSQKVVTSWARASPEAVTNIDMDANSARAMFRAHVRRAIRTHRTSGIGTPHLQVADCRGLLTCLCRLGCERCEWTCWTVEP